MFRESAVVKTKGLWSGDEWLLSERSQKIYDDTEGWAPKFRREVVNRIDENIFKPVFNESNGAPNAPIRVLVGMIVLKEGMGWSDSQLYEEARFNVLVRRALGLVNREDDPPVESTYYLFRKRLVGYGAGHDGEDLLEKAFRQITHSQCLEYGVSGRRIRMDSKLMGSNIAYFTRYEIIHETIRKYARENKGKAFNLEREMAALLAEVIKEEGHSVSYRSTKEEIKGRLEKLGLLAWGLLEGGEAEEDKEYKLLKRVFEEQYEVKEGFPGKTQIQARKSIKKDDKNKDDGSGTKGTQKVQNPHDSDCEYREKGEQRVKGYSQNLTETCDEDKGGQKALNLIVDIQTAGATAGDNTFFQGAVKAAEEVTGGKVKEAYTDGAYHSPSNQDFCKGRGIDFVLHGISGKPSKYDLSFDGQGNLVVVNRETGERLEALRARTKSPDAPARWRVKDGNHAPIYFEQAHVDVCAVRKRLEGIPKERLNIRNNVEATIFQFGCHYRRNKSRYRGKFKHHMWALARCLWINFRRVLLWQTAKVKKEYQLTPQFGV
jgi:hypothetical protein